MKNTLRFFTLLILFTSKLYSQHYFFPEKTSGFHLTTTYTSSGFTHEQYAAEIGYTIRGRLTGIFSAGINNYNSFDDQGADFVIDHQNTRLISSGLSFLIFKQEQQHTFFSFSVDAGLQFLKLTFAKSDIRFPGILYSQSNYAHTVYYGMSIYRNFHISNSFMLSPSFSYGRESGISNHLEGSAYTYYRFLFLLKLGHFYIEPALNYSDNTLMPVSEKRVKNLTAGVAIPINQKMNN